MRRKLCTSLALASVMLFNPLAPELLFVQAQSRNIPVQGEDLVGKLNLPGGNRKVSLSVSNENVRTVLHNLAQQGGFNLVMDDSVTDPVSVELHNVTINEAVRSVAMMGNLKVLPQAGNIFLVISSQAAQDKGLNRSFSQTIPVHNGSAVRIANLLNQSLFSLPANSGSSAASFSPSGTGSGTQYNKVTADPRSNSIMVVGTERDVELAEEAVAKLDKPRHRKTFYLSHGNALDIASILSSSIFNDGTNVLRLNNSGSSGGSSGGGGGSSSGGGGGGGASSGGGGMSATTSGSGSMPSVMRIERQDLAEGNGINNFGGGSSSGGGGGGGSSGSSTVTSGLSSSVTLRGFVKSSDFVQVSPDGPLVVPDSRQNAITIFGTVEQIALAEKLLPTLDARLPQVSIEASLIEIDDTGLKDLGTGIGFGSGKTQIGFNNATASNGSLTGLGTVDATDTSAYGRSGISFSTNPLKNPSGTALQIRSLLSQNKAKVLANPTVVATHDMESIISIVDEVVRRVTVQVTTGFATQTVEIGEAGIVLDILPKIGEDGTLNMRLRPSVTSVLNQQRDALGNIVTLLSKRDMLTQNVRIQDGETLVIGGLVQQNDSLRQDKLPGMGDLPIVGAMFRASQRNNKRSEIVLMITPHIINKTIPTEAISSAPGDPVSTNSAP